MNGLADAQASIPQVLDEARERASKNGVILFRGRFGENQEIHIRKGKHFTAAITAAS